MNDNSDIEIRIEDMLKGKELKLTRMHVSILKILLQADKPLSRSDILEALDEGSTDKVTVYRVLERFCDSGIANKLEVSSRAWLYELADNCHSNYQHPHFKCVNCGKIYCLEDVIIPPIKGLAKGFTSLRHKLLIEGIGPECCG